MIKVVHPDNEQFRAFVLGTLPVDKVMALVAHVANCKECRSTAESLDGSTDPFVTSLRGAGAKGSMADDRALKKLLDLASRIPQQVPMTTTPPALPMVAGHEVIRELARGGLGVIYLARHPLLDDLRAIKRPQSSDDLEREIVLARFRREVRAVGALRNDHIIRAHDAGVDSEGPYLVMEYVDGEPLSRLLTHHGPLAVPESCELVRQSALGLQSAHERGLVHRDIKPSNLMLARANAGARAVVIDWGLVKRNIKGNPGDPSTVDGLTRAGSTMGTYDYMAPEQAADAGDVDIRADIYSLGATLYCLLAGHPPFDGRTNREKLKAQLSEPFPPLGSLRTDVPKGLLKVLERMVDKDPAGRYATPGEVANELRPFCCSPDSRTLLGLLEATSGKAVPISEREPVFDRKTIMGALPASPMVAPRPATPLPAGGNPTGPTIVLPRKPEATPAPSRPGFTLAVAGLAGLLLVVGIVLLAVMLFHARKGDEVAIAVPDKAKVENSPKREESPVGRPPDEPPKGSLIAEDFHKPLAESRALPDGWLGEALSVVADQESRPCLEVNKKSGDHFVTLPPLALGGRFSIEGDYILRGYRTGNAEVSRQTLFIQLGSTRGSAGVPIIINYDGFVTIANNQPRQAPGFQFALRTSDFSKIKVSHFRLVRDGKVLRVDLDGTPAAAATIDGLAKYDVVRVGLTAGVVQDNYRHGYAARLYSLKVGALPPSPATEPPKGPPDPARPNILLVEDFQRALDNNRILPDGWMGDSLAVLSDYEKRACLEVNKKLGDHFVTLPPLALGDRFSIEGDYILWGYRGGGAELSRQALLIQLESSRGGAGVPINIDYEGFVTIANNEPRQPPGFFYPKRVTDLPKVKISRFRLVRDRKMLRVDLNGTAAAVATIDGLAECDTVRVGLTAGLVHKPGTVFDYGPAFFAARLYNLQIGTLPR